MSVLIKGITLEQFYRDLNYVRDMDVGWDAVQLPPHGRLIDADAFIAEQRHLYCENCKRRKGMKTGKVKFVYDIGDVPCRSCGYGDVLEDLDDAPTIIESTIGQLNSDSAEVVAKNKTVGAEKCGFEP